MGTAAGGGSSDLEAQRTAFDALVDATEAIDGFCSSSDWILPLHRQLGEGSLIVRVEDGAALALTRLPGRDRRCLLCGLDVLWGFARPVVGPDVAAGVDLLARLLVEERRQAAGLLLSGVVAHGAFAARLVERLGSHILTTAEPVGRRVAWLDGGPGAGLDRYLARRSTRFRRNARQAAQRAAARGVQWEWVEGGGHEVLARAIAVERRSWKGHEGSGLADATFARFYLDLADGLRDGGRLRTGFARLDGVDVGFIVGAVRGTAYRGLQLGYDRAHADLSLGNLLQLGQMERLVAEGITRYDLGMDMPYKAAWSDELFVTETLVLGV